MSREFMQTSGWGQPYHIKLKVSGNRQKQAAFHDILSGMDRDYPTPSKSQIICQNCGGLVYKQPRFMPYQLLSFAKQISDCDTLPGRLKVKVKRFCTQIVCDREAAKSGTKGVLKLCK